MNFFFQFLLAEINSITSVEKLPSPQKMEEIIRWIPPILEKYYSRNIFTEWHENEKFDSYRPTIPVPVLHRPTEFDFDCPGWKSSASSNLDNDDQGDEHSRPTSPTPTVSTLPVINSTGINNGYDEISDIEIDERETNEAIQSIQPSNNLAKTINQVATNVTPTVDILEQTLNQCDIEITSSDVNVDQGNHIRQHSKTPVVTNRPREPRYQCSSKLSLDVSRKIHYNFDLIEYFFSLIMS